MEKQANKLNNFLVLQKSIRIVICLLLFGSIFQAAAQDRVPFDQGKKYFLADVNIVGKITFNTQTVVAFSGLQKGNEITVPGEEISSAIKKLGKLGLFNEISFYVNKVENDSVYLDLHLEELPKLNKVRIVGVKKNKTEGLIKDNGLTENKVVNENLITLPKTISRINTKKMGTLTPK